MSLRRSTSLQISLLTLLAIAGQSWALADQPNSPLAMKLAGVKFDHYAEAPGYSEGPTWRGGEVLFCSGALLRVDAQRKAQPFLEIGPAGTFLLADGSLLICDNQYRSLLMLSREGKLVVVAERFEMESLRSLNDLSVDAGGNVYWTDPEGSSVDKPVGNLYRLRPDGRVDRIGTGLAFPNGIEVDPASKFLYVIESQSKKILRYPLPADNESLGGAELFFDLGGSGGDGCVFDAEGTLWSTDFHRPETGKGRITVISPEKEVLAYLEVPAKVVSNITFGGPNRDEIFCTTGDPPGVFHASVGVKGFAGHPGKPLPIVRELNVVPIKPHSDSEAIRAMARLALEAKLDNGSFPANVRENLVNIAAGLSDQSLRGIAEKWAGQLERSAARYQHDQALLAEVKRLGGKALLEVGAPRRIREIAGDRALAVAGRIVELDLNERTDGHKEPEKKALENRVHDKWLKRLAGQDRLRALSVSGTAVTSKGLVHLKDLVAMERLNLCLTECSDEGFEYLAGMTKMRRMTICASKITGSGFKHLQDMKQLESINLHSAPASDEGLAAIGGLTSLRRLEIVHTHVTDAGLRHLGSLVNLQQLHIHGPETTPDALPIVGRLKELYELDVYDKAASNQTLEQIGTLPKLRMLRLFSGVFDDAGVKRLAGLTTLEHLTLDSDKVTDESVAVLAGLKNLRTLQLSRTKITPQGQEMLKRKIPRLVISP